MFAMILINLVAGFVAAPAAVAGSPDRAPSAQSRTARLSAGNMFRLAEAAAAKGDTRMASSVYAALETDPNADVRAEARFRAAKLLMKQNRNRDAAVLLRRLLDEKPDAHAARLELARSLQLLGDADGALRQVRAVQAAGLPPQVARLVDRYSDALRAARLFGLSFEIALAPDSNINRSTRSDTLGTVLGDFHIDEDSKAKSGMGLALRGQSYRRFPLARDESSILVRLSGFADLYRKTDFNDVAVDFAAGPEFRIDRAKLNLEIGATQRWFGQEPVLRSARVGATWALPVGRRSMIRTDASIGLTDNRVNDLQDGRTYSGQLKFEHALSSEAGIGFTVGADRQALKDPGYATSGWRLGALAWRDIGRATLTAGIDLGRLRADERLALFPSKRADDFSRISIGATFRNLTFRGFAPVARFVMERNRSSIAFYDYRCIRTELGIARAF
jgi:hypothetical protein